MKSKLSQIKTRTIALFNQGLTVKELTLSIIVSLLFSVNPIMGISTFSITALSLKWKLNLPIMMTLSYLMWPVQILLIIPFIRVGEYVFSIPQSTHTLDEILYSFQNHFFETVSQLSFELLCAFGGWLFSAVPLSIGLYLLLLFFFKTDRKE